MINLKTLLVPTALNRPGHVNATGKDGKGRLVQHLLERERELQRTIRPLINVTGKQGLY